MSDIDRQSGECKLPNGCTLWWKPNEVGGRIYTTDENSIESEVWDTSITSASTLNMALAKESELNGDHYGRWYYHYLLEEAMNMTKVGETFIWNFVGLVMKGSVTK